MKLEFVNHASIILEHNGTRLMTDPWIFGDAFNHGWSLLSESKFQLADFDDIDYIWFSHEHPDHFNMTVLKEIHLKERITVLFQDSLDHRVAKKCKDMGFQVIELKNNKEYNLCEDFSIKVIPVPYYDSWNLVKMGDKKILNLNDCVIDTPEKVNKVKEITGDVDVLLTQYGNANGLGLPNESSKRRKAALEKLDWVKLQVDILKPTFTIPFTSFVNFSHTDNFFNNDEQNKIDDVEFFIRKRTDSIPVILYPGDQWNFTTRDNRESIQKYQKDYSKKIDYSSEKRHYDFDELVSLCDRYRAKLKKKNNWLLVQLLHTVKSFQTVVIYITDLDITITFDLLHGLKLTKNISPDISMDADSLAFVFQFEYGADTLHVNGRYIETPTSGKFFKMFAIGTLNNNGRDIFYQVNHSIKRSFTN